ncbi:MAG: PDZ domain-containing protein, partial [Rhodobacteraceae bacterium]|nr:PDZ domain-containing protein [Paracoccaceae bacterium]
LGNRPQNPGEIMSDEEEYYIEESILGMKFGFTPELEDHVFAKPDTVVNEVLENSPAAEAGIQVLDQVEMVNSEMVLSTRDIRRLVDEAIANNDEEVDLFIIREGVLIKVVIQLME